MKKLVGVSAIAAFAFVGAANAADMPVKAQPITPAPVIYNWSGFYVGATAGYNRGKADITYSPASFLVPADVTAISAQGSPSLSSNSFTGGVELGYNAQWNQLVAGIVSDFQYIGLKASAGGTFATPSAGPHVMNTEVKADWLVTLRGRVGYAFDRTLLYATGGLAVSNISFSQSDAFLGSTDAFSISKTKAGWTVGGGVEYALPDRWSLRAEYLYVDLGHVGGPSTFTFALVPFATAYDARVRDNIVRLGVSYKLN